MLITLSTDNPLPLVDIHVITMEEQLSQETKESEIGNIKTRLKIGISFNTKLYLFGIT